MKVRKNWNPHLSPPAFNPDNTGDPEKLIPSATESCTRAWLSIQQKIKSRAKKQENTAHTQEKKQSKETVSEYHEMPDLADKDFTVAIKMYSKNLRKSYFKN